MLIASSSGTRHEVLGTTATIKLASHDTGGRLAVVEHQVPRDAGPPLHLHRREDELLYVVAGTFDVTLGDPASQHTAEPGAWLYVPAGTPHSTRCTSDAGRLLSIYTPGGGEAFFAEIDTIDQTTVTAVVALADRHGMTVLAPAGDYAGP
jgi:quercetin dioxygenase-like cupin family protein